MGRSRCILVLINIFWISLLCYSIFVACGKDTVEPSGRRDYPPPIATPGSGLVTFERDVGPIMQANCAGGGCHGAVPFPYATSRGKLTQILARVRIPEGQTGHMPKGAKSLSPNVIAVLEQWGKDGYLQGDPAPAPRTTPARLLGEAINVAALNHARAKNPAVRANLRYLTITHLDDVAQAKFLVQKTINSLSSARAITLMEAIDGTADSVFGIDISELNLLGSAWDRVAQLGAGQSVKFFTDSGRELQALTKTQYPFMRADLFAQLALTDPTYRQVHPIFLGITSQAQLEGKLGLLKAAEFQRLTPHLSGFLGRPIASGVAINNRLVSRHEIDNGDYWETFDCKADPLCIFTQFPVRVAFGGVKNFSHAGGEIIFNLPNGMLGFLVVNNLGAPINEVPLDVATNTLDANDPVVTNGVDCFSCHAAGVISLPHNSVLDALKSSGSAVVDAELGIALYRDDAILSADIERSKVEWRATLKRLGGDAAGREPISQYVEAFENAKITLDILAAEVYEDPNYITRCVSRDDVLLAQFSGLFSGSGIDRKTVQANFARLTAVCELGREHLIPGK